jgi:hypothetical protein
MVDVLVTTLAEHLNVRWFHGITPERDRRERELIDAGCPLPLRSRLAWARAFPKIKTSLLVVEGAPGELGAIGVEYHPSRALPGHHVTRVLHAGASLPPRTMPAAVAALANLARGDSRSLRIHLECFSRVPSERHRLGELAREHGFTRLDQVTHHEYTLATDLGGRDNATHFASMNRSIRNDIRAFTKYPLELRPIRDGRDSQRMNALMRETLARTGAMHVDRDYTSIIRLAVAEPSLARLVGLYRTDAAADSESLFAFALGLNNGDHVAYDIGASGRVPEHKNLSLVYPLLWDLISWARDLGASWFDYGGVPKEDSEGEERLARISDFKRRFEKNAVQVADEWVFTPHPMRSALAKAVSRAAEMLERRRRR